MPDSRHLATVLYMSLAAWLPAHAATGPHKAPADSSTLGAPAQTLRIIRSVQNVPDRYWGQVLRQQSGCRFGKKLPPEAPFSPSAEELRSYFDNADEELFDGDHYAHYAFTRVPTVGSDCGLYVLTIWSVQVATGCKYEFTAGGPISIENLFSPVLLEQARKPRTCRTDLAKPFHPATPVEKIAGVECMWTHRSAELTFGNAYDSVSPDSCYYARQPHYRQRKWLPVVVAKKPDDNFVALAASQEAPGLMFYGIVVFPTHPVLVEEGKPIDANRFTRQAAEQWVNQPPLRRIGP